jgi:hypothetical protein
VLGSEVKDGEAAKERGAPVSMSRVSIVFGLEQKGGVWGYVRQVEHRVVGRPGGEVRVGYVEEFEGAGEDGEGLEGGEEVWKRGSGLDGGGGCGGSGGSGHDCNSQNGVCSGQGVFGMCRSFSQY